MEDATRIRIAATANVTHVPNPRAAMHSFPPPAWMPIRHTAGCATIWRAACAEKLCSSRQHLRHWRIIFHFPFLPYPIASNDYRSLHGKALVYLNPLLCHQASAGPAVRLLTNYGQSGQSIATFQRKLSPVLIVHMGSSQFSRLYIPSKTPNDVGKKHLFNKALPRLSEHGIQLFLRRDDSSRSSLFT